MAHFSESLCEEVIRTEGGCGLSRNEITQMARFALRAIRNENPLMRDYLRYRWLRDPNNAVAAKDLLEMWPSDDLDNEIDAAMSGSGTEANQQRSDAAPLPSKEPK